MASALSDVIWGDCYKILPELDPESFDLILTDPPYDISRPNNFHTMGREGFDWEWDKDCDPISWVLLAAPLLVKGGSLISFMDWKLLGQLTAAATLAGLDVKDPIVWEKNDPQPRNTERRYVSDKEFAFWAVRPGKWTFNKPKDIGYLRSYFRYCKPRKRKHATKKSPELWRDLIEIHSNPGDRILDPFCGEGTTGVVAKQLGRSSLQIEKKEEHFRWALEALQAA